MTPERLRRLGEFLTKDHASRFDPYIKWIGNPAAGIALAAVAAALCGLFLHPRAFVLSAGLTAVLGIGLLWPWLAVRGLSGTLTFGQPRAREGDPVEARLAVRNRMPWGAWGMAVRGAIVDRCERAPSLEHAPGREIVETRWQAIPAMRGDYPIEPARITTAFPFGLREASRPLVVPNRLIVWPRTFPIGPIPEAASGREGEGLSARNRPGHGGEFLGVRPYRRGDSLRRVHWAQTARLGELIVCEMHAVAIARVQIVLDLHPDAHRGEGPNGTTEWAVRVAASFAEGWVGDGAEVELICGNLRIPAGKGPVRTRQSRVLDAFARLAPNASHSLGDVLDGPDCRTFFGGLRIIVTTDLGAWGLSPRASKSVVERFVILDAAAFDDSSPSQPAPLPFHPWIRIDHRDRVARSLISDWEEVALA